MEERRRESDVELGRLMEKVDQHETDIRAFAPLIAQTNEVMYRLMQLETTLKEVKDCVDKFHATRTRNQGLIWVAVIGLLGTFLTSTATVLVAVL